ncbi:MAG: hypothetical protein Q9174_003181 [Haloplaca sp. 1 TL-2023]
MSLAHISEPATQKAEPTSALSPSSRSPGSKKRTSSDVSPEADTPFSTSSCKRRKKCRSPTNKQGDTTPSQKWSTSRDCCQTPPGMAGLRQSPKTRSATHKPTQARGQGPDSKTEISSSGSSSTPVSGTDDPLPYLTNSESIDLIQGSINSKALALPLRRQQPMRGVKVCRSIENRRSPHNRKHPGCSIDRSHVTDEQLPSSRPITYNGKYEFHTPFPKSNLSTSAGLAKSTPDRRPPAQNNGRGAHLIYPDHYSPSPVTLVEDKTDSVDDKDYRTTQENMLRMKREATSQLEESNRRLALASNPHDDVLLGSRSDFLRAETVRNKDLKAKVNSDKDFQVEIEKNHQLQLRVAALEEMIKAVQEANRRDWELMFAQVTALVEKTIPQWSNQEASMNSVESSAAATEPVPPQISNDSSAMTQVKGQDQQAVTTTSPELPASGSSNNETISTSVHAPDVEPCPRSRTTPVFRNISDRTAASKRIWQRKKKRKNANQAPRTQKEKKRTVPKSASGNDETIAQGAVGSAKDLRPSVHPIAVDGGQRPTLQPCIHAGFLRTRNLASHSSNHAVTSPPPPARSKEPREVSSESLDLPDLDSLLNTRSADVHDSTATNVRASKDQQLSGNNGDDKSAEASQAPESGSSNSIPISAHQDLNSSGPSLLPEQSRSSLTQKSPRRCLVRRWKGVNGVPMGPSQPVRKSDMSKTSRSSKSTEDRSCKNKASSRSQGACGISGHVPVSQSAAPMPSKSREILIPRKSKSQAKVDRFLKDCHCGDKIDDYFRKEENIRPDLTTWAGEKHQFVSQCRIVSNCIGHQQATRHRCQAIIAEEETMVSVLFLDTYCAEQIQAEQTSTSNNLKNPVEPTTGIAIAHTEVVPMCNYEDGTVSSQGGNNDPARRCHSTIPPEIFYPNARVSRPRFRHPFDGAPTSVVLPDSETQGEPLHQDLSTANIPGDPRSSDLDLSMQHQPPALSSTSKQVPTPKGPLKCPSRSLERRESHQDIIDWTATEYNDDTDDQPAHNPLSRASKSPSPIQRASDTTMAGALPEGFPRTPSISTPQASSEIDIIFSDDDDDNDDVSSVATSVDDPSANDARAIREQLGCGDDDSRKARSPIAQVSTPIRRKKTLDRRYHTEPLASPPKLDDVVRRSLIRMRKPLATLLNDVNPDQGPLSVSHAAIQSQEVDPRTETSSRKKKKKMTPAQRYRLQPQKDERIPCNERRSDEELIEIGQLKDAYTRHYLAPYAFLYVRGRLHPDYVRLADKRDENGKPVFNDTVTRRLFGETTANRRIEAQRAAMQRQGNVTT